MKPNKKRLKSRLAARHVRSVRRAISASVDIKEIVRAWYDLHPEGSTSEVTPDQAREWAKVNVIVNTRVVRDALARIYADGVILGDDLATYDIARQMLRKAAPDPKRRAQALAMNWATWRPGNRAAALKLRPTALLYDLLNRGNRMADEITMTTVKRIGTILSEGLKQGVTPKRMSILIDELVDDPVRALTIAQTETSFAVVEANLDLYEQSGVEMVEYLVADPCDLCSENLQASPISITEEWPNGNPPVHPNCMCDVAPYVVSSE